MEEKKSSAVSVVFTGILALAFVVLLGAFIVIPVFTFLLLMILDAVFLVILINMIMKKRAKARMCSILFTCIFAVNALFWGMFVLPIKVYTRWQYPLALEYATNNTFLPEKLPDSAENIEFDFMPTILQGGGHVAVGFTADDEYVAELTDRLNDEAVIIRNYGSSDSTYYKFAEDQAEVEAGHKNIVLYEGKIRTEHPNSTAYIIETNFDWNHPHSNVVFIDGNYVFFSQE